MASQCRPAISPPDSCISPKALSQCLSKVSAPARERGAAHLGRNSKATHWGTKGLQRVLGAVLVWGCRVVVGGGGLAFDVSSPPCRSYVGGGLSGPHGHGRAEGCEPREISRGQVQYGTYRSFDAFGSQFCAIAVTPPLAPGWAEVWSRSREQGDSGDGWRRDTGDTRGHTKNRNDSLSGQEQYKRGLDGPRKEDQRIIRLTAHSRLPYQQRHTHTAREVLTQVTEPPEYIPQHFWPKQDRSRSTQPHRGPRPASW